MPTAKRATVLVGTGSTVDSRLPFMVRPLWPLPPDAASCAIRNIVCAEPCILCRAPLGRNVGIA